MSSTEAASGGLHRGAGSRLAERVLGVPVVAGWIGRLRSGELRVLAYHDIPDVDRFRWQLAEIARRYTPVTFDDVERAFLHGDPLPDRAVWLTFDDAYPAVCEVGLEALCDYRIRATVFVCPGVADSETPYWWEVVEEAAALRIVSSSFRQLPCDPYLVSRLKRVPDALRREIVADLTEQVERRTGDRLRRRQITRLDLRRWLAAGHTVGNHSWDHPCLDRCTPEDQIAQVETSHRWLFSELEGASPVFSYPNGDWTQTVEDTLARTGYTIAVLFDHEIVSAGQHPLRLSRLRVDSDAAPPRFRAILSGGHSLASGWRLRPLRGPDAPGGRAPLRARSEAQ